jgi:hypothetical protein
MVTITLRKLTWKSKWDFNNKYPEHYTLQDVFKQKPSSLVWLYYTHEKITFVDEVWNEIKEKVGGLKDIPKPGIDKDFMTKRFGGQYTQKSYMELRNIISAKKLNGQPIDSYLLETFRKKKSERGGKMWSSEVYTKATLQGQNHNRLKI